MSELRKMKDNISTIIYGMTAHQARSQGICIDCKLPPTFYSEAGRAEYQITGLCEPCFDRITAEPGDEDEK